jgi:hypothetical protein
MPRKDMGQAARPPRRPGFPSILCRRTSIRESSTLRSAERGITGTFYGSTRREKAAVDHFDCQCQLECTRRFMAGLDVRWIRILFSRPRDVACCASAAPVGESAQGFDIRGRPASGDVAGMGHWRCRSRRTGGLFWSQAHTDVIDPLCYAFFAGVAALSWNYRSLFVFRFLTGLGLGAEWGPGAAIVAEFWPAVSRGLAGGVLHAAYGVGLLFAAGIWLLLNPGHRRGVICLL